jgi:2-C-methyl-D-erythritol 4-phosphate cytidylyltransferase/2-C-methyl-D-erythritol 2,4-cyclodiphosphate synthase
MPVRRLATIAPKLPLTGPTFLLLTAAGTSRRFGTEKKELVEIGGESILLRALRPFLALADLAGIVVTYPEGGEKAMRSAIPESFYGETLERLPFGIAFQEGGSTRQESVLSGLRRIVDMVESRGSDAASSLVLVHDGARPWASTALVRRVAGAARAFGAAVPLLSLSETPKFIGKGGLVAGHPERDSIALAQTPQGFALLALARAHELAHEEAWPCTDDSSLWDHYIGPIVSVEGERMNKKITFQEDLDVETPIGAPQIRIGEGWDIHTLVPGRALLLGGVRLDHPKGESGHSDGDVLWHAIIDALFGASRLGDIGSHFPPSDAAWKDADSSTLASEAISLVRGAGWELVNLDCTIILEKPRLGLLKDAIATNIARVLDVRATSISVKAKTNEGVDAVGRGEAVEARALALLYRKDADR